MGYVYMTSQCFSCKQLFAYNPHRVPSLTIKGVRQPFCRKCVERANPKRIANGLEAIHVSEEAYEPIREEEL